MDLEKTKTIMEKLTDGMKKLKAEKSHTMSEFRRPGRAWESHGTDKVISWLNMVSRMEEEVTEIRRDYEQTRPSFILGIIPNYVGIYRIGNRAGKLMEKMTELELTYLEISLIIGERTSSRRLIRTISKPKQRFVQTWEAPEDWSELDTPPPSVNIQDNDMITGLEFCNKYNKESSGTSEEEQTKSSHGSQISNFREEWLSLEVPYADIKDATNGLSKSSEIGRGGYGSVYKGKLGETTVAIKMLDSTSKQGEKEFFQELEVLSQMRHPNLVKLVGACFEVNALVYEFLPNGSLEDCLKYTPDILTWQMRTRIIYEICSALISLHSKSVVHGDLKPANILLDANFKSKLSDFGLCRLLPKEMTTAVYLETVPKGTSGYVDPWFLETWILRPGSDLYSFGITILKLLTGNPPIGLGVIARDADENSFREMIDPTAGSWPFELAKELLYWSLQCCYHNEKSSELLEDMSTCIEEMLTEIETFQEGRFKVAVRRKKATEDSLEKEEEKTKVEENEEEPVLVAVVLKVEMHSEAYAQEIKMKILGLEGVHAVELVLKTSEVTVTGVFDFLKLVLYIYRDIGTSVELVKVESVSKKPEKEKPKEGEKVKDEKKDLKEAEGEKVETEGCGIKVYNQGIAVGSSVDLSEFNDHHELLDDTRAEKPL